MRSEDGRTTGAARRYRASALDRALAPSRTVAVVGPVRGLDEKSIVAKLDEAARCATDSRITLAPRPGAWWDHRDVDWDAAVSRLPALADAELGQMLDSVRTRPGYRQPLEVVICGDHLVVDYSHGLGDGRLGLALLAILAGADAVDARPLARGLTGNAVAAAIRHHFLKQPVRVRDMLRARSHNKAGGLVDVEPGPDSATDSGRFGRCHTVTGFLPPGPRAAVQGWVKERHPGASRASVTIALLMAALRAEGVPVDERVSVLIDCRRYLGPENQDGFGNFAVAVPVLMPPNATPVEVTRHVRTVTDSGWPIAVLAVAEIKSRLPGRRRDAPQASDDADSETTGTTDVTPARMRLSVSDLGTLSTFGHLDWASGRPPQVAAYLEPDGPDAITVLADELQGGRTFAASFWDGALSAGVVERALERICSDPVGVLNGIREGR